VWGTKIDGVQALLAAMAEDDLRAVVLFSSSTARFGRTGQVDYAMANEALNKIAAQVAAERKQLAPEGREWRSVLAATGQPPLRQTTTPRLTVTSSE
ncbi:MAG: hypothetical protein CFK52_15170, partial [Chloracidobacterium sp. CP2_5A]